MSSVLCLLLEVFSSLFNLFCFLVADITAWGVFSEACVISVSVSVELTKRLLNELGLALELVLFLH